MNWWWSGDSSLIHDYQIKLSDVDRFEDGKLFLTLTKEQVEHERRLS